MQLTTISDTLDAPPPVVWEVIGDFGGLKRWSRAVSSCMTEGSGIGSFRIVQIGEAVIRERLEAWDPAAWYICYRPVSGSVMPVSDMVVSMTLTLLSDGKTKLDWTVHGEPTIAADKAVAFLQSRYQSRIAELKECVAADTEAKKRLQALGFEEVPLAADAVWDVIGDFESIRKWAPAVMSERIEQTREGKVRVLALPPEGREVRELLWAETDYSYTYKFLGDTPNARNYFGTISVVPLDASLSRIELRSDFEAAAGLSDEEAVANMTKGVRANLRSMTKALGLTKSSRKD
jgi:hypothetical protein